MNKAPHLRDPEWVIPQLRKWAADQRERQAWRDKDHGTYRYRADLLEAAADMIESTETP